MLLAGISSITNFFMLSFRLRPRELRIRLGEYDLRFPNETRALEFKVVEIRMHKGYIAMTYTHDIAILKFTPPTIFNTYIWPVCLPPVGAVFERKSATVIGRSHVLKMSECNKNYFKKRSLFDLELILASTDIKIDLYGLYVICFHCLPTFNFIRSKKIRGIFIRKSSEM